MMDDWRTALTARLIIRNDLARECLAEFFGIFTLMSFGLGCNAQTTLGGRVPGVLQADRSSMSLGWGLAVTIGVWIAGDISGAHLNPAITVTMAVLGRFPFKKVPCYLFVQYFGAFVASVVVYAIYKDALDSFDGGQRYVTGINATAAIWATYPAPYLSTLSSILDSLVGTALFIVCIMALLEAQQNATGSTSSLFLAVGVGAIVTAMGHSFAINTGYALNPARDFAPRVFTAFAGWGLPVFTEFNYFFWIPMILPYLGSILGAYSYLLFVGLHIKRQSPPSTSSAVNDVNHVNDTRCINEMKNWSSEELNALHPEVLKGGGTNTGYQNG